MPQFYELETPKNELSPTVALNIAENEYTDRIKVKNSEIGSKNYRTIPGSKAQSTKYLT